MLVLMKFFKDIVLIEQFTENARSKTPRCKKLSHFSEMQNDALTHRAGLPL